ncbi:MAG: hypothetical protein JOZ34_05505 [Gammaproteobacteria bacterium]|nr:hypothetical protein [Gammaproteobacteria bacterium]
MRSGRGIVGEGRALYRAVVDADLEGMVAKHLADIYHPKLARWHKISNSEPASPASGRYTQYKIEIRQHRPDTLRE